MDVVHPGFFLLFLAGVNFLGGFNARSGFDFPGVTYLGNLGFFLAGHFPIET